MISKTVYFLAKNSPELKITVEETAQKIDYEIKKIIDDQYERAKKILNENIEALHKTADALLEHETIEGKHIHEILDKGEIISPIVKSTPSSIKNEESEEKSEEKDDSKETDKDDLGTGPEPMGVPA